jgi:hypothetical protein
VEPVPPGWRSWWWRARRLWSWAVCEPVNGMAAAYERSWWALIDWWDRRRSP